MPSSRRSVAEVAALEGEVSFDQGSQVRAIQEAVVEDEAIRQQYGPVVVEEPGGPIRHLVMAHAMNQKSRCMFPPLPR